MPWWKDKPFRPSPARGGMQPPRRGLWEQFKANRDARRKAAQRADDLILYTLMLRGDFGNRNNQPRAASVLWYYLQGRPDRWSRRRIVRTLESLWLQGWLTRVWNAERERYEYAISPDKLR